MKGEASGPHAHIGRRALTLLVLSSLLLSVGLAGCGQKQTPTTAQPTTIPSPLVTTDNGTPHTPGAPGHASGAPGHVSDEPGATAADPLILDGAARIALPLPSGFAASGWEWVRGLPQGTWILNSGSRLVLFDPANGAEEVICEAEFGIQAVANDHQVAYGIGGDEVPEVFLYDLATAYTVGVLYAADGFLDLEWTRDGGLLASRLRYTGEEAVLDAWLRYDTATGAVTEIPSGERSYAQYVFERAHPELNPHWTYETGVLWHTAWLDGGEQLYYAAVQRRGRDDYAWCLYRSTAAGGVLLYESPAGPLPPLKMTQNMLQVGDGLAYATTTGRWYAVTGGDDVFAYGASLLAQDARGVLVAARDRLGRLSTLYRLPLITGHATAGA